MRSLTRPARPRNAAPVSLTSRRSGFSVLFGSGGGRTSELAAMGSVGTLYAIVHRTSNATSQVNWRLYRKPQGVGQAVSREEREEVTRHIALDVWNKPNPFYTRQEFVETFQQHVDLTGEGWWVTTKNVFGWPEELWPVRPDRMSPVPHPTEFISGYIYHGPEGEKVPLGTDEVIQLRMPNPLDLYRGMGPVQAILADIDSTKYSAEWNRNFFLNSAEPGGIIEVPDGLSDPDFADMRRHWQEQHQGVNNAHRVAILEHGKWVDRNISQKDMQFVELREVSREVIREAFGFPKPMLGAVDDINRANATAGEVVFSRWLVKERADRIKGALNNDFLPMFPNGSEYEFDYDDPSPEDREADNAELTARTNAAKTLVDAGWNPDDALRTVGLPEMEFIKGATA